MQYDLLRSVHDLDLSTVGFSCTVSTQNLMVVFRVTKYVGTQATVGLFGDRGLHILAAITSTQTPANKTLPH